MLLKFLVYGSLGWIIEVIWTGAGSIAYGDLSLAGHTYLWMFPIYGTGILLEPVYKTLRKAPWLGRGLVWVSIIFFIEYVTGWGLQYLTGSCPWDYTGATSLSLNGFIRLDYAPAWFAVGMIFEQFHDRLSKISFS